MIKFTSCSSYMYSGILDLECTLNIVLQVTTPGVILNLGKNVPRSVTTGEIAS